MNTAAVRRQTSFRLSEDLLHALQSEAKIHNRSLNNLVESVLMAFISKKSNPETLRAIEEAKHPERLDTLDISNFRAFVDSL